MYPEMFGMIRKMRQYVNSARQYIARVLNPQPAANVSDTIREATVITAIRIEHHREMQGMTKVVRELLDQHVSRDTPEAIRRREQMEMAGELLEASMMGGSGPWLGPMQFAEAGTSTGLRKAGESGIAMRENFIGSQGANGLFELEMANWEWRRDINLGWLEFSRWGIQQIILISRLYYIKNPIIRRLIDVCAIYVFGRGVEISSPDPDANDQLKRFLARNQKTLGQAALTDLERRKDYDGNLFFVCFPDAKNTGEMDVRTIDAVEMQDIVTDPEDVDAERFFHRKWTQRVFNEATGAYATESKEAWYPALGYEPESKPDAINSHPVMWDSPVYHRKCGTAGKWTFGCPRIYPALDWAKAARKFLEHCASVKAALAQIAMTLTTKGGQQAMAGMKQQLETTVGTGNSNWYDQNPTANTGSTWISGPGTQLAAFKSSGEGGDPEEVRRYMLMACMVKGVPETFLADVSTGNLATATTLDRPTELAMQSFQEEWREDLVVLATAALNTSVKAPGGKLREALLKRKAEAVVDIREAARVLSKEGWRYVEADPKPGVIEVKVTFPAIREGDIPELSAALATAFATGTVDPKAAALKFCEYFDIENAQEIVEAMYPEGSYDPDKTKEPDPAADPNNPNTKNKIAEALERLHEALKRRAA